MPVALLLDTFSLFFRAFFALPPMSTERGEPTSALYGFSALLLKLMREQPGAELCFALDTGRPTFRHREFQPYKQQRERAPTPLVEQLRRLDQLLEHVGAPVIGAAGFEADDVLASVAANLRHEGRPALIVSGDRDLLQAAHGSVQVHFVGRRGKDAVTYDEAAVRERFGVPPWRLPSFVALVGDASDNLPGVPGIGPGTARRLLAERENVEQLLADSACITPPRVARALLEHAEQIRRTERLAGLRSDVPLPPPPHLAAPSSAQLSRLRELFETLEFKSLRPRLDKLIAAAPAGPIIAG
ncbi:MAG TPA: 5'-3' exonuclease H3TH domain-containing protein [Polyangiaceae bacterium]|nr:5'-3' exonuclease H3TH domain-containing protein [Polyangiaceae bacterium]